MSAKVTRRWLSFSLRTFFVVVTIFCVWLGYEVKIVHERRELFALIEEHGGIIDSDYEYIDPFDKPRTPVAWYRRLLGDRDAFQIILPGPLAQDDRNRIEKAFPEGEMFRILDGNRHD